jgi:hypothetical protein
MQLGHKSIQISLIDTWFRDDCINVGASIGGGSTWPRRMPFGSSAAIRWHLEHQSASRVRSQQIEDGEKRCGAD